ncbi:MAG TPA: glycosyltransferase family 2 protein [Blastocatellia bacterium]|nr:glycosyltransferase family 2 protein [Blastocatellia bacterium]
MPTADRRSCVPLAIRCFQRQDYQNKELVILDDGDESVADLIPDDPQIRYQRAPRCGTLGEKRNECVIASRGDLIMHWDDDDWMAPYRISYQVEALLGEGAEVCGLQRMLFCKQDTGEVWLYEYPDNLRPWLAGGSLLYTRDFWRQSPFPGIQVASDTRFVWDRQMARRVAVPDYKFYVAMIHAGNTSPKNCSGPYWTRWPGSLQSVMGADYDDYQSFSAEVVSSRQAMVRAAESASEDKPRPAAQYGPRGGGKGPKVSCILATGDRPAFTRQAIRCFLRQTFDDSELIVVDDGKQSVSELCDGLFRVRYIRLDSPTPLGRKLNTGIEQSSGAIIQKWDDDDFYQHGFLARSVDALEAQNEDWTVVTWDCFSILMAGETRVRYSGHGWTTGATLCFHRELWERGKFRDEPSRVDSWFIEDHAPRLIKVCAPELIMVVRHGQNTWKRLSSGLSVDDYFGSLPTHNKSLNDLIEPIDRAFYCSLRSDGSR